MPVLRLSCGSATFPWRFNRGSSELRLQHWVVESIRALRNTALPANVRDLLVVQVPHPCDKRMMAVLLGPTDRLILGLKGPADDLSARSSMT